MNTNHLNNFNIELSDIWNYEKYLFEEELKYEKKAKSNTYNRKHFLELYRNAIDICIHYGKSYLTKENSGETYVAFQKIYKEKKSFKERIRLGWFDFKGALYYLPQLITIPRVDQDFHYFFALKVDQYVENIFLLDDFFEYQLRANFNNDLLEFMVFLDNLIIQHDFIDDKIYEKITRYILDIKKLPKQKIHKKSNKQKPTSSSYTLIGSMSTPNFFQKNNQKFLDIFHGLLDNKYVHNETSYTQFKSLFSEESIPLKKIHWTANSVDLNAFISILCSQNKIVKPNTGIWVLTSTCFIDKNKEDFNPRNLGNSIPSENTKRIFRKIVAQFP
ncbi:hypothetical protein ACWGOQ_0006150 [Aquimarina sp. M1]